MGEDKSFLTYYEKPQCYHIYEMLQQFCEQTFISCNAHQLKLIDRKYNVIADHVAFAGKGPATGVLTAFSLYPQKNFLIVACDYPLLTGKEIAHFLHTVPEQSTAAAFYDEHEQSYQPVIAFYSVKAGSVLMQSQELSLKNLLQFVHAYRHIPLDNASIKSIDTKEASEKMMNLTNQLRH